MGRYFRTDPVLLLERNYFEWAVTIAAYEVAAEAEANAAKKQQNAMPNVPHPPGH